MKGRWMVVGLGLLGSTGALAQEAPVDYQALLERALTRESNQQSLCVQQREDIIKYFREELKKEREKKPPEKETHKHAPIPPEGK